MFKLQKFNLQGQSLGEIPLCEGFLEMAHAQSIKDYIVAIRANMRQWSACTKTRAEVKHTTKKATRQKGTGGARHGSLVAPQYRGGGRVFAPRPKFDQHVRINKKERRAAIRHLLGEKMVTEQLCIIDSLDMDEPKTRVVNNFLAERDMGRRVLFLGESARAVFEIEDQAYSLDVHNDKHDNFAKSARNLPGVRFQTASSINGYDILSAQNIIVTEAALKELEEWLCPDFKKSEEVQP